MAFQTFLNWKPARMTWMRRWSSSFTITTQDWSLLMTMPEPDLAWHSSRLIRCRSTRICFCSSSRVSTGIARPRFICGSAATACMHWSRMSRFCASFAQPGNGWPARLRARRMRVMSTTALLLAAVSVSSECESISSLIFISGRGLAGGGLADLRDLVAVAGRIFIALRLDGLVELGLELRQTLVKGLLLGDALRHLAGMRAALVHGVEHRLEQAGEMVVTGRATKAAALLEILLGEAA